MVTLTPSLYLYVQMNFLKMIANIIYFQATVGTKQRFTLWPNPHQSREPWATSRSVCRRPMCICWFS